MKTGWMALICFCVTAAVVGIGTYVVEQAKSAKDIDALQAQISDLNRRIADTGSINPSVKANSAFAALAYIKGEKAIWTSDTDGANAKESYLFTGDGNLMALSFSMDRKKLAFTIQSSENAMYVMNADLTGLMKLNINNLALDTSAPSWSPDGQNIAFAGSANGKRDIYAIDVDSGLIVNLTKSDLEESSPSWSPDGATIAFASSSESGSDWSVNIMNADGTNKHKIGTGYDCVFVSNTIIASSIVDALHLVNTEGEVIKKVVPPSGMHWGSPSGLTVADGVVYVSMSKTNSDQPQTLSVDSNGNTIINGLNGIVPVASN